MTRIVSVVEPTAPAPTDASRLVMPPGVVNGGSWMFAVFVSPLEST